MMRGGLAAGIGAMLAASALLPVMDAVSKLLTGTYPPIQIAAIRYLVHTAVLVPLVLWVHGGAVPRPARPGLQILRGVLMAAMAILYIEALARLPLVTAISIVFVFPFLVTMAAPVFLGERVGLPRWLAVAAGFGGALLVIRPESGGAMGAGSAMALAAAVACAGYIVLTRKLSGQVPPLMLLFSVGVVGLAVTGALAPFDWRLVAAGDLPALAGVGLLSALTHLVIILAYSQGDASLIAPFTYFQIVGNVALGLVMFGDFPAPLTWAGIAIIVAGGVFISLRERRARRRAARAALQPSK